MGDDDVKIIFPDTAASYAVRTMHYIDKIKPYIGTGFRYPAMKLPFVFHAENFQSNGLVMWLPKRIEFLTSPAISSYSMPWYKQLTAHEYRHAVQYNNLNRGVIKALSYILGQQGSTVGLLFLPLWFIEGDAVMIETDMSTFGRALQPSFTLELRALGRDVLRRRSIDKWFSGSYLDHIPDHYQFGYQMASYTYWKYDKNIWDKVAWYSVRNPYMLFTTPISLKKFYDTSIVKIFHETFARLNDYWESLPEPIVTTTPITELPRRNYTSYKWPIAINDTTLLSLKSSLTRAPHFTMLDLKSGKERRIAYTGDLSTRPIFDGKRVWWTEYRRSPLFAQRVFSQLCYMDIEDGKSRHVKGVKSALYPTPTEQGLAWIEYLPNGTYELVHQKHNGKRSRHSTPYFTEVHGLAWDNYTRNFYLLMTDDSGMWIGCITSLGEFKRITQGAYITLSELRAKDGKLFFGSIESGRDEAHYYDLKENREYRITSSRFGAFAPAPIGRDSVAVSDYTKRGYRVAMQRYDNTHEVEHKQTPKNILNPPRKRLDVLNLDTVRFTGADSVRVLTEKGNKRYRKGLHLVNVHSWAPISYNPWEIIDENNISASLGVTLISQNLLSNSEAYLSWGWNASEGSLYRLGFKYFGLGLQMKFDAAYGGKQNIYALSQWNPINGEMEYQSIPSQDSYFSVGASLSLPLLFARGYHTRQLSLSAGWNYSNGLIANVGEIRYDPITGSITNLEKIGFREGLHKLAFSIGYSDMVRVAPREFAPRLGYSLISEYAFNPANGSFSDLISFYGKFYLPGFVRPQSLMLEMSYQTSIGGFKTLDGTTLLTYKSARLIPRGYSSNNIICDNYLAGSINYQIPVWYPEGGIPSVLYFKRIRLNLGFDYAHFNLTADRLRRLNSYGVDLLFDVNFFRMPDDATSTIKLSLYKPKHSSLWFGFGVGLPF